MARDTPEVLVEPAFNDDGFPVYGELEGEGGAETGPETGPETVAWPEISSLRLPPKKPFPLKIFPDWLGSFVEAVAIETQTPTDLGGCLALGTLAAGLGGRVAVQVTPKWEEGLNLFVAVAMESGRGKSPVFKRVMAPLEAWEEQLQVAAKPRVATEKARLEVLEKRLATLKNRAAKSPTGSVDSDVETEIVKIAVELELADPSLTSLPRLLAGDVTAEKLARLLIANRGRIAIVSEEGGIFQTMAGRYSSGDANLDVFLQGFSNSTLSVDRRSDNDDVVLRCSNVALTIVLAIQPEVVRNAMGHSAMQERGLLDRFLFSLPDDNLGARNVRAPLVETSVSDTYERSMLALFDSLPTEPATLVLGDEALECFYAMREQLEHELNGPLREHARYAAKLVCITARVAGILHVAHHSDAKVALLKPIGVERMKEAVVLTRYAISQAQAMKDELGGGAADSGAVALRSWLERAGRQTFSSREAHQANRNAFRLADDARRAIRKLERDGWVRKLPERKGRGRHSECYEVHPEFHRARGS